MKNILKTFWAYMLSFTVSLRQTAKAVNTAKTADELSHMIKNTNTKVRTNI